MKRLGKNTKERRIILGTNAVLADVFLDIRLHPIPNFPILKYPYEKSLKRVEAGLRDGGLETQKLWGGGWEGGRGRRVWIGRSKKHSWKGKISRISRLEKISSIDLQVFTNRPNFRMGCKTCKVNKISSFLASSVQGGFSSKQHFKTDNFWKTLYCEAVRSPVLRGVYQHLKSIATHRASVLQPIFLPLRLYKEGKNNNYLFVVFKSIFH